MSSQREVLIRILALLQRKTLLETKKCTLKCFKTALFNCAINEKCCNVDRGQGIWTLFSLQWESAIQRKKKNANARGSARGGGGLDAAGIDWCITQVNFNHVNKIEARQKVLSLNEKLSEVQLLRLRATFHACLILVARENYVRDSGNQP